MYLVFTWNYWAACVRWCLLESVPKCHAIPYPLIHGFSAYFVICVFSFSFVHHHICFHPFVGIRIMCRLLSDLGCKPSLLGPLCHLRKHKIYAHVHRIFTYLAIYTNFVSGPSNILIFIWIDARTIPWHRRRLLSVRCKLGEKPKCA